MVLVSLWPNDDVMWDLGANQAMSGFQCLSALRCDGLTWSSSPQHQELLTSEEVVESSRLLLEGPPGCCRI